MTLGLNWEGTKKYILAKNSLPIRVDRQGQTVPLEFTDLSSPPIVAVNCDNQNVMWKEKGHIMRFEKSTKNDNIEFRKKNLTKWKSNLKSIKSQYVNSYYVKNEKATTINLIIIIIQ